MFSQLLLLDYYYFVKEFKIFQSLTATGINQNPATSRAETDSNAFHSNVQRSERVLCQERPVRAPRDKAMLK